MAYNPGKNNIRRSDNFDEYNPADSSTHSYLGKTIKIDGEISCDEFLTVEGDIKGNIKVSKTLTIGENGHVKGEIDAKDVKIIGKAEGNITASGKLEISAKGHFKGSVTSDTLIIEEGAVFKGKANMDRSKK
jgi:cytoskeletal protein CcmA (bactofilin family)